jgi:hypothetical protein
MAGLFSLEGSTDIAVVEGLIQFDNAFDGFSFEGVLMCLLSSLKAAL